jgi:hypothetical protein
MNATAAREQPLQIVTTCRAYDLPVFEIAADKIEAHLPCGQLYVIAPAPDCPQMRRKLGKRAEIIPEDEFLPGMNIGQVRQITRFGFPKNAGWYFQQFLKLQFAFLKPEDDFYLIWDADTIPLRPMRFFDGAGRMLLTKATEHHLPYFETYRRILGEEPNREFSFISQHMLVQKSIAREMLAKIEQLATGKESWAWRIVHSLPEIDDLHLFSEFETCGHYLKNHHPERAIFVERPWWRFGSDLTKGGIPKEQHLEKLARDYEFVSFEKATKGWRYLAKKVLTELRKHS